MHDKGVVHRDIKTENLLMGVGSNVCQVVLQLCKYLNIVPFSMWVCFLKKKNHIYAIIA